MENKTINFGEGDLRPKEPLGLTSYQQNEVDRMIEIAYSEGFKKGVLQGREQYKHR